MVHALPSDTYAYTAGIADTASIKITWSSPYKGGTKQWSNRMHFVGGTPPDASHWNNLADAIIGERKALQTNPTQCVQVDGYAPGSDLPVYSAARTDMGTYSPGTGTQPPLEVCALLRYTTDQRSSKNHPIYLYEYIHDVWVVSSAGHDALLSGLVSGWTTRGNDWISGYSDGVTTYHRAGPRGAVALTAYVHPYVTHRDFPS